MKRFCLSSAMALCASAGALAQETTLPVPSGYAPVAGTQAPVFVKTDSTRENLIGGEKTTFALVMSYVTDAQGNQGYAVRQMTAWCRTSRLSRTSVRYYNANQQQVAQDDTMAAAKVGEGTDDALVHARLCSEWDAHD